MELEPYPNMGSLKSERSLSPIEYTARNLAMGLSCEGVVRYFALNSRQYALSLSFCKQLLDSVIPTQVHQFISNSGQYAWGLGRFKQLLNPAIPTQIHQLIGQYFSSKTLFETLTPAPESIDRLSSLFSCDLSTLSKSVQAHVDTLICTEQLSRYFADNQEWIVVTTALVGLCSLCNITTANRLKNAYLRNTTSIVVGTSIAWLGAQALGYRTDYISVSEIGLRSIAFHQLSKAFAGLTRRCLEQSMELADAFRKPLAFSLKKEKVE